VTDEPECFMERAERYKPGLWTYRQQHPLKRLHEEDRHGDVHKFSDHLTRDEPHRLELSYHVLGKMKAEDTLSLILQSNRNLKFLYRSIPPPLSV
jgi:hypothetical protein